MFEYKFQVRGEKGDDDAESCSVPERCLRRCRCREKPGIAKPRDHDWSLDPWNFIPLLFRRKTGQTPSFRFVVTAPAAYCCSKFHEHATPLPLVNSEIPRNLCWLFTPRFLPRQRPPSNLCFASAGFGDENEGRGKFRSLKSAKRFTDYGLQRIGYYIRFSNL